MGPGFSLLEVLVAVLVLSIGLLGVAALQAQSLRYNHEAYLRGQAVLLSYDMADRMRANSAAFSSTSSTYVTATAADGGCAQTATADAADCTSAQIAAHDLQEWNTSMASLLPSGAGVICLDTTPNDGTSSASPACSNSGGDYAIKVFWTEIQGGTPATIRHSLAYIP
jgi:type IV pilus assembly protein PilV